MSDRLRLLMNRIEQMPEEDQEFVAALLEAELADEARWQKRFAKTPEVLEKLAAEARRAHKLGLAHEMDDCAD
jgi:hypothetical protein